MTRKTVGCLLGCICMVGVSLFAEDSLIESEDEDGNKKFRFKTIEEILEYDPKANDYKATKRCINPRHIRGHEVLSSRFIAFKMNDDSRLLLQLKRACPSIRRGVMLQFEKQGVQFCRNDSIRGIDPNEFREQGTHHRPLTRACRIPGFEPISREQLVLLRNGLRTKRLR